MTRTILICGQPRCGSSLTMHMLHSGGMATVGRYPGYENEGAGPGKVTAEWLHAHPGKALKLLMPELTPRSALHSEKFAAIYLTRDTEQQWKSGIKFARAMGAYVAEPTRGQRRAGMSALDRDTLKGIRLLQMSGMPLMVMRFERLILTPDVAATEIADFLERYTGRLNAHLMARQVRPRSPDCLPYVLELGQVE